MSRDWMPRLQGLRRRLSAAGAALCVTAVLVYLAAAGVGPVPPLGPVLDPGTGAWATAADAQLPHTAVLHGAAVDHPVRVTFESNGTAHIQAATEHDLFWTIGYLHARFRLVQMDLERRQGEGLLAAIVGAPALASDRFEDQLGLQRTAQAAWRAIRPGSRVWRVETAYAAGVTARIGEDEQAHTLPLLFTVLGYQPRPWTPVDSLVVQGDLAQTLSFTTAPLDYALLVHALGYQRTMQWFPLVPPNEQHLYDPGPYGPAHDVAPLPVQQQVTASMQRIVGDLVRHLAALPPGALHQGANSNNWAVDGTRTASGKPLLAGDPRLMQTLPSIWYQVDADAPDYHVAGVTIPGLPVVIIGHNRHIAWSQTNVQNQATLFYVERTDAAHPDQYYWCGAWRRMRTLSYTIPVKGGRPAHLDVKLTVHDPANPAFSLPNGTRRTAADVMCRAFRDAMAMNASQTGSDPQTWQWGRRHLRFFPSLAQIAAWGYGPRAADGDGRTVNAAGGTGVSTDGPSWRFIMDWGTGQALDVYPGGQSENPASPWYANQVAAWWAGRYYPLQDAARARRQPGSVTWTLER